MKLYFSTREAARQFATKSKAVKVSDEGTRAPTGKRWVTKLVNVRKK